MTPRQLKAAERKQHQARMAQLKAEAQAIVATGVCPCCGTSLRHNLALAGWWQCGAFGVESFRLPQHRGLPACSFQTFTE